MKNSNFHQLNPFIVGAAVIVSPLAIYAVAQAAPIWVGG